MLYLGCHLSSSKGYAAMGRTALSIGANTFQFFTRNPRGGAAKSADPADAAVLVQMQQDGQLGRVVAHAPYTLNPCSKDERTREFAREVFESDLQRMELTPGNFYNFHPGSHLNKISVEDCLALIAESINLTLEKTKGVTAVIENTAGQGSNLGSEFWQLRYIIDRVNDKSRVGICLDTCHTYTAGYDIVNDYDKVFDEFEKEVGFEYLRGMHLNDSKKELGSHVDRHDNIGQGLTGSAFFERLMQDSRFDNIPLVLETPDESKWAEEIAWLRSVE